MKKKADWQWCSAASVNPLQRRRLRKRVLLLLCWAQSSAFNLESKHAKSPADEQYLGHLDSIFSQCGQPHLSSTGLVLDVVDGADLGAHVLQVGSGGVDGARVSRSAGHRGFLLQRGLLGNWGFGDDAAPAKCLPVLLLQADSRKHPVSLWHSGAHGDGQLQALVLILPEKVTESTNSC